jgi:hypothetical protein
MSLGADRCYIKRGYWWDELGSFKRRDTWFAIYREDQPVAAGRFVSRRGDGFFQEFWEACDALSSEDEALANVVMRYWDELLSPFDYGDIAEFRRLAATPPPRRLSAVVDFRLRDHSSPISKKHIVHVAQGVPTRARWQSGKRCSASIVMSGWRQLG